MAAFQTNPRGVEAFGNSEVGEIKGGFRRTLVGLKLSGPPDFPIAVKRFRRTLVGLKHTLAEERETEAEVSDEPSWG